MNARSGALLALVVIVALVVPIIVLRPREAFQPSTQAERAAINTMESDLMALARQESFYYRTRGAFTTHAESTYFIQSLGVTAPKITLRDSGYYAIVTHTSLPRVKCAIAVGTSNPVDKSAKETFPACK